MYRFSPYKNSMYKFLLLAIAAVTLTSPLHKVANAACEGSHDPIKLYGGRLVSPDVYGVELIYWGEERSQYASTCDGDGEYRGVVRDLETDGRYVQVRLSTENKMKREWIQTYTGRNWKKYRSWGSGTYYMRICKSGTPIGVAHDDERCSYPERHVNF